METPTRLSSRSSLPAQSVWDLSPTPETDALLDKLGKLNEQQKAQILEHLYDLQWLDKQNALTSSCASELRRILEQGGKDIKNELTECISHSLRMTICACIDDIVKNQRKRIDAPTLLDSIKPLKHKGDFFADGNILGIRGKQCKMIVLRQFSAFLLDQQNALDPSRLQILCEVTNPASTLGRPIRDALGLSRTKHLWERLKQLQRLPKIIKTFNKIDEPNHLPVLKAVELTVGAFQHHSLDPLRSARMAVLITFLDRPHQESERGTCWLVSTQIRFHKNEPISFMKQMKAIIETGACPFVSGGTLLQVPLCTTLSFNRLYDKKLKFDKNCKLEHCDWMPECDFLQSNPLVNQVLDALGFEPDTEIFYGRTSRIIAAIQSLSAESIKGTTNENQQPGHIGSIREIIENILLSRFRLTKQHLRQEERLRDLSNEINRLHAELMLCEKTSRLAELEGEIDALASHRLSIADFLSEDDLDSRIREFRSAAEKAHLYFCAQIESSLLRAWEHTLPPDIVRPWVEKDWKIIAQSLHGGASSRGSSPSEVNKLLEQAKEFFLERVHFEFDRDGYSGGAKMMHCPDPQNHAEVKLVRDSRDYQLFVRSLLEDAAMLCIAKTSSEPEQKVLKQAALDLVGYSQTNAFLKDAQKNCNSLVTRFNRFNPSLKSKHGNEPWHPRSRETAGMDYKITPESHTEIIATHKIDFFELKSKYSSAEPLLVDVIDYFRKLQQEIQRTRIGHDSSTLQAASISTHAFNYLPGHASLSSALSGAGQQIPAATWIKNALIKPAKEEMKKIRTEPPFFDIFWKIASFFNNEKERKKFIDAIGEKYKNNNLDGTYSLSQLIQALNGSIPHSANRSDIRKRIAELLSAMFPPPLAIFADSNWEGDARPYPYLIGAGFNYLNSRLETCTIVEQQRRTVFWDNVGKNTRWDFPKPH